jgi:hypothetical protein
MPMSPHEAATMLGVRHTADAETVEAAIARQRVDFEAQAGRAATPEMATYWRNRLGKLDEARDVLRRAAEARARAAEEAAEDAARAASDEAAVEPAPFEGDAAEPTAGPPRAGWERLQREIDGTADARPGLPWEASEAPTPERALATVKRVLFEPSLGFSEMKRTGGLAVPLWYSLLVGLPAATVATFAYFLLQVSMNPQDFNNMSVREAAAVGFFVMPLYVAVVYPLSLLVNAGLQHLAILLLEKSPQPFETTFRVVAYAMGTASALQWIPILGLLASGVAQIVLNIIGLSRAHEIPPGRAALAYFLPWLVCGACFFLLVAAGTWLGTAFTR